MSRLSRGTITSVHNETIPVFKVITVVDETYHLSRIGPNKEHVQYTQRPTYIGISGKCGKTSEGLVRFVSKNEVLGQFENFPNCAKMYPDGLNLESTF